MKILHYFLGFPPYRSGGLTKYAFDLMEAQVDSGNQVMALWPGQIKKYGANPIIKNRKSVQGIKNFELINPLPVPLDEGINGFEAYTSPCDNIIYVSFLEQERPDVIHLHTLMGLHREFIDAAKELKIKTVYTSHDYFGLCPKVTLYRYGSCCDDDNGCRNCIQCNVNALPLKKIQVLQSPLYRAIKNTSFVKKLRKNHRDNFFAEDRIPEMPDINVEETSEKYRRLREYYTGMYEKVDLIHFNSTLAESIFRRYITPKDSKVVSITHKGIKDNRNNLHIKSNKLRILFLAPAKPFKGFNVLKAALDELWNSGKKNFELRVFSPVTNPSPYMLVKEDGFQQSELPEIFSNADVLVAPSVWYETFGFTVLEALSYGVPVIISDHVGAKDLVKNDDCVVEAGSSIALLKAIENGFTKCDTSIKEWHEFLCENMAMYGVEK